MTSLESVNFFVIHVENVAKHIAIIFTSIARLARSSDMAMREVPWGIRNTYFTTDSIGNMGDCAACS
jgi:hypothetical protein